MHHPLMNTYTFRTRFSVPRLSLARFGQLQHGNLIQLSHFTVRIYNVYFLLVLSFWRKKKFLMRGEMWGNDEFAECSSLSMKIIYGKKYDPFPSGRIHSEVSSLTSAFPSLIQLTMNNFRFFTPRAQMKNSEREMTSSSVGLKNVNLEKCYFPLYLLFNHLLSSTFQSALPNVPWIIFYIHSTSICYPKEHRLGACLIGLVCFEYFLFFYLFVSRLWHRLPKKKRYFRKVHI